ncbi:DEAD/DEAH box helicase, putative [Plasmodium relictum]|uniref:DEAD/DEAH box helicase, putative n=1 Tax=Plasmodium relictum TaxID=85471 RepID=A0A1J1H1H7_PLARL|nr:DEAD/DEAH box helicase, putative [Plasmodium relictum]CRG98691.1 DEAD/DEAH box helicase, putative [Plasmodium relictum]
MNISSDIIEINKSNDTIFKVSKEIPDENLCKNMNEKNEKDIVCTMNKNLICDKIPKEDMICNNKENAAGKKNNVNITYKTNENTGEEMNEGMPYTMNKKTDLEKKRVIEPTDNSDFSEYLYLSEHLKIRKDNKIFVTRALNDYINEHINVICLYDELNFNNKNNKVDKLMDIGLKLKYLRYKDNIKKRKKKEKCKKASSHNKLNNSLSNELKCNKLLTHEKLTEFPIKDTTSLSSSSTLSSSCSDCSISSKCSKNSKGSSQSSYLFSDSSNCDEDISENSGTSDEEILKNTKFDEEELSELKKLEKAKNIYFRYVDQIFIRYNMMANFNLDFFENLLNMALTSKGDKRIRCDLENTMTLIKNFLSDKNNFKKIELNQKKLRSDVINSMFGFYIINESQPMKIPIKGMNNSNYKNQPISNIFAYKSRRNKNRVDAIFDKLYDTKKEKKIDKREPTKKILDKNKVALNFNQDAKKIDIVVKNNLEEYIKSIQKNSKIHNKMTSLKQYILTSNWNNLKKHNNYITLLHEEKRRNKKSIAKLCYNQMKAIEQKRKVILEKEEKERMRLLKENDMDAYIKLIKTAKNKRLQELLDITEEFLNNMSKNVLHQKKDTFNEKNNVDSEDKIDYEENMKGLQKSNYKNAREKYYNVSHTVKEKVKQPSILTGGTLMKYQLEGLEWLISLYNNNLHGILADEMGLGKTIQTISLFAYLKEFKNNINVKNLIIVPLSTLPNWLSEFSRWCPSLNVITYRGSKLERKSIARQLVESDFDICLTTFDFIIKEKTFLMKISWNYIVVDEGHRMKNNKSRFHSILSEFKSKYRVLLTGTPLQNNLSELWSLLNFLLPKIFSSCVDFEKWFVRPLHNEKDVYETITEEEQLLIINRLHSVLLPFMLRRVKKDVLKSLPKKYEYNVHIELSLYQKILYKQIQTKGFKQVNNNGSITTKNFQNIVMQLRKIVNHPYLFLYDYEIDDMMIKCSGKFEVLDRMLPKLLKFKHKVLIFSQMTKLMNILCDYLEFRGYKYHRLDGNIGLQERKKIIDEFNKIDNIQDNSNDENKNKDDDKNEYENKHESINEHENENQSEDSKKIKHNENVNDDESNGGNKDTMIFILSTRSGSLGLNLQTADTVIIFDSDFNPHQDIQAMCRCHRIGQKNVVKVFRFITLSGVEQLVFKKAQHKLSINDKVIQAGLFNKIYNDEDRQNKLKNIIQRNQNSNITIQPTNPLLLNYYMGRSEEELEYFHNFDKNYFGEYYYSLLNLVNHENESNNQFTYMSEDEKEENNPYLRDIKKKEEKEDDYQNEDEETDENENKEQNLEENEYIDKKKEENMKYTGSEKEEKRDNESECDLKKDEIKREKNGNMQEETKKEKMIYKNKNNLKKRKYDNDLKYEEGSKDEEEIEIENSQSDVSNSLDKKLETDMHNLYKKNNIENNPSLDEEMNEKINLVDNNEVNENGEEDYYSFILKEKNQNEIERILIKSNKLINKEELPSYLFYEDSNEMHEISLKRKRKVINTNLMEEEKLTEKQFLKLIDASSSKCSSNEKSFLKMKSKEKIENESETETSCKKENSNKMENKKEEMDKIEAPNKMRSLIRKENLDKNESTSKVGNPYNMRSLSKKDIPNNMRTLSRKESPFDTYSPINSTNKYFSKKGKRKHSINETKEEKNKKIKASLNG